MPAKPKAKFQPIIIASREGMTTTVNDYVRDKIEHAQLTLSMEEEIACIQKRYQQRLDEIGRRLVTAEAGLQVWAVAHRAEEFPEKKSIDLQLAVIGFRDTPHRVEKLRGKDTFEEIAARMAAVELTDQTGTYFCGDDYVTYPQPVLNKKALLADRLDIPRDALKQAGITFASDEIFYIEPKSEVLEGMSKEVAA